MFPDIIGRDEELRAQIRLSHQVRVRNRQAADTG
jgi:hypothetical protein